MRPEEKVQNLAEIGFTLVVFDSQSLGVAGVILIGRADILSTTVACFRVQNARPGTEELFEPPEATSAITATSDIRILLGLRFLPLCSLFNHNFGDIIRAGSILLELHRELTTA